MPSNFGPACIIGFGLAHVCWIPCSPLFLGISREAPFWGSTCSSLSCPLGSQLLHSFIFFLFSCCPESSQSRHQKVRITFSMAPPAIGGIAVAAPMGLQACLPSQSSALAVYSHPRICTTLSIGCKCPRSSSRS